MGTGPHRSQRKAALAHGPTLPVARMRPSFVVSGPGSKGCVSMLAFARGWPAGLTTFRRRWREVCRLLLLLLLLGMARNSASRKLQCCRLIELRLTDIIRLHFQARAGYGDEFPALGTHQPPFPQGKCCIHHWSFFVSVPASTLNFREGVAWYLLCESTALQGQFNV